MVLGKTLYYIFDYLKDVVLPCKKFPLCQWEILNMGGGMALL